MHAPHSSTGHTRALILYALAEMLKHGIRIEPIRECLRVEEYVVTLQIEPHRPHELTPVETAILAAATNTPQTRKQLARRAGYRYNTHTSQAAKRLLELGLLKPQEGGYVRA